MRPKVQCVVRLPWTLVLLLLVAPATLGAEFSSDPSNLLQTHDCDLDSGSAAAWTVTPAGSVTIQNDVQCPLTAPPPVFSLSPATGTALGRK